MRYQFNKRNLITLILGLISVTLLIFISKKSSGKVRIIRRNATSLFLDNILDQMDIHNGIYLVDTTRMKKPEKKRQLTLRQACAIESAALSNPHDKIYIIFVSPQPLDSIDFTEELEILNSYPNIHPLSLNLVQFVIDTPLEKLIGNGDIFDSIFIKSHTSDVLRMLLIWKYGGTYLDSDMIVRLELNQLPQNYICKDHGYLNGAIINLDTKRGKKFAEIFMKDMLENFNGTVWGSVGPDIFLRVMSKICGTSVVREMRNCDGFNLLPDEFCYPIKGVNWMELFDESSSNSKRVMDKVEYSYVVHFWNKLSQKELLKCDSKAVS